MQNKPLRNFQFVRDIFAGDKNGGNKFHHTKLSASSSQMVYTSRIFSTFCSRDNDNDVDFQINNYFSEINVSPLKKL